MINTVIVDDDIEMLDWLEQIITWEDFGFNVVARATSGNEALAICRKYRPDFIITDITMPTLSGLDLISQIKDIKPDIKSVIITCHDDFNYAQRAVKVEADDYLLKYSLTKQSLIEVLLKIKEKLLKEDIKKEEMYRLNSELLSNRMLLKEKFITDLIEGSIVNKEDLRKRADVIKVNITCKPFRLISSFIDNYDLDLADCTLKEANLLQFCIMNIADEIMQKETELTCFPYGNDRVIMLYSVETKEDIIKQRILDKINEFHRSVKQALNMNISSCISNIYMNYTNIKTALCETAQLRDSYFFEGSGKIVIEKRIFKNEDFKSVIFDDYKEKLLNAVKSNDKAIAIEILEEMYLKLLNENYCPKVIKKLFSKLSNEIEMTDNEDFQEVISKINTYSELKNQFNKFIMKYMKYLSGNKCKTCRREVEKVLVYIDENLNKTITCDSMASMVNMNSSYFSRLFKNQIGVNFSDYLIGKRIEKSTCYLAKTEMTIEDITKAVGLEQPSYFYKLYKKVTGKTPGEVRKRD